MKKDEIATNVLVKVKCGGKTLTAELDLLVKHEVLELKNLGNIGTYEAEKVVAQITRQKEVLKEFKELGREHAGVVIRDAQTLTGDAERIFREAGVKVWERVEGQLKLVVTSQ